MQSLFSRFEVWFERHERKISSGALIGGFIFDSLTLRRVDLWFENVTIISYLLISGGSILLLNYYEQFPQERVFHLKVKNYLPLFIQFAFGGLFSAFFIFYTRSGSLTSSWPFVVILLTLLVGNEFFKLYYQRLTFQISIYFLAVFSFFIFFVPVMLKSIGVTIFLLSGLVSLLFILLFSKLLFRIVPRSRANSMVLRNIVVSIFLVINLLYFTNLIPPIPLALEDVGVYYSITRIGDDYIGLGEKRRWFDYINIFSPNRVKLAKGEPVYVFSSVFAPTDLNTSIVHHWQYLEDTGRARWVSAGKIEFPIRGGRDGGYRGFSQKDNLAPGIWRVNIETKRGQVIGRIRFKVEDHSTSRELQEEFL